ncbi:MAG: DUF2207 family protein [Ardenticatenaceae bacterium]
MGSSRSGVRDTTHVVERTTEYLTEPPDDLPPGVVGTLFYEKANLKSIMATLVDLGRQGVIRIEEIAPAKKGWFGNKDAEYLYTLQEHEHTINNAERVLIEVLFGDHKHRKVADLQNKFYKSLPKIEEAFYEEITFSIFFNKKNK